VVEVDLPHGHAPSIVSQVRGHSVACHAATTLRAGRLAQVAEITAEQEVPVSEPDQISWARFSGSEKYQRTTPAWSTMEDRRGRHLPP
jgi:hypothetical protein